MPEVVPEVCVLLTPRALGGHEKALLGWLADAVRMEALRPRIVASTRDLQQACDRAGLAACVQQDADGAAGSGQASRLGLLAVLRRWPVGRPLLLAPGVLHSSAWLLAAAVALGHRVWVYVPMTHSAVRMNYRWAALRDVALAPWLRRVEGWITIDDAHARQLDTLWQVPAPVYVLPNVYSMDPAAGRRADASGAALRVLFLGRFDMHQKGLDWLVGVLRARPPWAMCYRWQFQGRGPGEGALQELASALGPHRVQVQPFGPVDDALAVSDVLLLPSRFEGVPLVALEATSYGVPVIASQETGLSPLLPTESLFKFGDAAGLQAALQSLREVDARRAAVEYSRNRIIVNMPPSRYHRARRTIVRALQQPADPR